MQLLLQKRIVKLRKTIASHSLSSLLITEPNNITYLTGEIDLFHDWRDAILFVTNKSCILLLSPLRSKRTTIPKSITIKKSNDFPSEIKKLCNKQKIFAVGFEQENLRVAEFKKLKKILAPIILKSTKQLVAGQRMIKDKREIENIKKACRTAVSVYKKVKTSLTTGQTEKEIALKIERLLKEKGSDGFPHGFKPIVAFGSNSATPHHLPTNRKLRRRDIALLDFGCSHEGYASDLTRMVFIGKPNSLAVKLLTIVKKAQKRALVKFVTSKDPREIDKAARDFITNAGYGKFFIHGTGHSLGLSIHEAPAINLKDKTKIQPEMVFAVEPGIYLPGKFGIRHEDTILVTSSGIEILTME